MLMWIAPLVVPVYAPIHCPFNLSAQFMLSDLFTGAIRLACVLGSLLFFPLDGFHRGEDTTVAIHRSVKITRVARTLTEGMNWVLLTSNLRVGLLNSSFPVFIR